MKTNTRCPNNPFMPKRDLISSQLNFSCRRPQNNILNVSCDVADVYKDSFRKSQHRAMMCQGVYGGNCLNVFWFVEKVSYLWRFSFGQIGIQARKTREFMLVTPLKKGAVQPLPLPAARTFLLTARIIRYASSFAISLRQTM